MLLKFLYMNIKIINYNSLLMLFIYNKNNYSIRLPLIINSELYYYIFYNYYFLKIINFIIVIMIILSIKLNL